MGVICTSAWLCNAFSGGRRHLSVYWGQTSERIYLNIALRDVVGPDVNLDEDNLSFQSEGLGGQGRNNYAFSIEFYLPVSPEKSKYRVTDKGVEFYISKGAKELWPRLTYGKSKPAWLKVDFDHFECDSSVEEDSDTEGKAQRKIFDEMEKEMNDTKKQALQDLRMGYLFFYNLFQLVGYSFVFVSIVVRYVKYGEESVSTTFEAVGSQLMVCQLVACLEVIHPLVGLVKTGIIAPLMQVFGRNLVLFVLILLNEEVQDKNVILWLFSTWSAVEIFRYPFYILSSINKEWGLITWLRYTVWIPLYPMGIIFEGLVMVLSLPYFERSGRLSLTLPNALNFSFNFPYFMRFYMLAMLPAFYLLMTHMYHQRKKKLMPLLLRKEKAGTKSKGSLKGKPTIIKKTVKMD